MKIFMLRQPKGIIQGVSLKWYRVGHVYDLPSELGAYLVAQGYGIVEMRSEYNAPIPVDPDRRRKAASPG